MAVLTTRLGCSVCGNEKLCCRGMCKPCYDRDYAERHREKIAAYQKKYHEENKDRIKETNRKYQEEHREEILKNKREYHWKNREEILKKKKIYCENHKDEINKRVAEWQKQNPEKVKKNKRTYNHSHKKEAREYHYNRRRHDPIFKLISNLRSRVRIAIKTNAKVGSAIRDLGCTIEELKIYIETKFTPEMNWDNWGPYWHLDHIIPLSRFDLSNREEFLKACHYTNLQPLEKSENLRKKNKLPEELSSLPSAQAHSESSLPA